MNTFGVGVGEGWLDRWVHLRSFLSWDQLCELQVNRLMHYSIHHQLCSVRNLANYFLHPSLVIYFFATPAIKLKLGLQIGGRLLITNHLNQSLWLANQKTGNSSQIIFITLFCHRYTELCLCLLPALANCAKMLGQNHFAEPNRDGFWHFFIQF
jgi:hypothetical protein